MGVTTFLLRLVGMDPEQREEQKKFTENLNKLDETDRELDGLLAEIRQIDQVWEEKKVTMEAASVRPPSMEAPKVVIKNGCGREELESEPSM